MKTGPLTQLDLYLQLLGYKARDRVTGFTGVVSSISFDLYGCVQAVLTPEKGKDGKMGDGHWFDFKRLEKLSKGPVMEQPEFVAVPGGEKLPAWK